MPTSLIFPTTLKNFKSITNFSLLFLKSMYFHLLIFQTKTGYNLSRKDFFYYVFIMSNYFLGLQLSRKLLMQLRLQQNCLYALLTTPSVSRVNNAYLFVINYFSQRFHELSKPGCYNFVPAFWKLSKGRTKIVQACDNSLMPGFYASKVLAFILGVKLFDYMVDGGEWIWWGNQSLRMPRF